MTGLSGRLRRWSDRWPRHLGQVMDIRDQDTPAQARRRRVAVSVTCVAGSCLLGTSLSTRPGSRRFYVLTFTTAATWLAGGLLSGPLQRGWIENRARRLSRPFIVPVAAGIGTFGAFCLGALLLGRIPPLHRAVAGALVFAERGSGPLVLLTTCANGVGEEVFFRGAVYAAVPGRHPLAASTAVYVLATSATRNPALMLAAGVMGTLFGYQRRVTQGLQAPLLTHLTWSTLTVTLLPAVVRRARIQTRSAAPEARVGIGEG